MHHDNELRVRDMRGRCCWVCGACWTAGIEPPAASLPCARKSAWAAVKFVMNLCTCSEPMVPVPAEAAVTEQANVVRELKEGKGLTNQDEEVQAAVAELIKRKEKVERVQHAAKFAEEQVPTA